MKESERFREFAEKFVLARAPDGPKGIWQAVLDAKTAFKQVIRATEEFAKPEREAVAATAEHQRQYMLAQKQFREQELIEQMKKSYVDGGVVVTHPEDQSQWQNELVKNYKGLVPLSRGLVQQVFQKMKSPAPSTRKT